MQPLEDIEVTLKNEHIQEYVLKKLLLVLKYVMPENNKYLAKLEMSLQVLVLASTKKQTIHSICKDHKGTKSSVTIRNMLKLVFSSTELIEKYLNRVLKSLVKRKMLRGNITICTDVVLIGYYGSAEKCDSEIKKGQKRNGTNKFHGYSSVYLRIKDQRYTLAVTYVWSHDSNLEIIRRLNRYVAAYGVKPSVWLLDRGYYSVDIIKWFHINNKPFLMLVPKKGYKPTHSKGPTGTYVFQTWTKSGETEYTIRKKHNKDRITTKMTVTLNYPNGPKNDPKISVFAHFGLDHLTYRQLYDLYKTRFSIETSYRQMNQARARTASRSPSLRYLMFGVALILRNVWIFIHFHVLYKKQRGPGGKKIDFDKMTLISMLTRLQDSITSLFPVSCEIRIKDPTRLKAIA